MIYFKPSVGSLDGVKNIIPPVHRLNWRKMLGPATAVHLPLSPPSLIVSPLLPFRCPVPRLAFRPRTAAARPLVSAAQPPDLSAAAAEVDMFCGRDGVWTARQQTVVVLWDLDNKPPRGPPYEAAVALRRAAELFGRVVEVSAYANRHAFVHLPQWVLEQRRERHRLNVLERKGLVAPAESYTCGVCGRKCRTNLDLKKHFRQLHVRERQKKLDRMRSLKGKKRQRYRERFIAGNHKYEDAARTLLTPKTGYGLASELRRAGVFVRTVADKPQAADSAVKRQMLHSMTRGIDWLFLVSDDSDFSDMIRRAREADLRTVVVGDGRTALGRQADIWVPWVRVENGEVGKELLQSGWGAQFLDGEEANSYYDADDNMEGLFASAGFYEDGELQDLDVVIDEIVIGNSRLGDLEISAFSEEEVVGEGTFGEEFGYEGIQSFGSPTPNNELLWDSEAEEEDPYI
ncbi:unnamed protein product [Musa acuminata subsp. malaccensis]|uniref:(wild Malaysian banana) hypothetical protein n=1 Tax=Musa acuminata subsp. malaccensis TaxID=214687 RepID=A0A804K7L0_MUSAM|nr:PREDICTED: uncharacterized protein LOC103994941 [Musa acuminata subsp. malaccensis]XP_009413682.2 PREDICTED: uncharacterized protein LOC103994941 [Musa acuminata subsp. malaccensis]XP_009413683.2 PREDICTED: uncharacterized protein LOC103994941 [Musa acuminata subsp. malaccensis]XP_018685199.1 PREDICTED: uncharacterized protein LOC103994941 [Musa acuminata subsp. malaccensis]CAG1832017.1 unnamed protein product [Musa acuminata subsp. malaccensis]